MSDVEKIKGWPEYEISRDGTIVRVAAACGATPGKPLKWQVMSNGYAKVALCRNAKRSEFLVHRLVAAQFISPIPDGLDVCHRDGNKLNNCVGNLRIDTRKGNMADQIKHGKTPRGERSGSNKYPLALVRFIRDGLRNGLSPREMSELMEIPLSTIYGIQSRQTWAWL